MRPKVSCRGSATNGSAVFGLFGLLFGLTLLMTPVWCWNVIDDDACLGWYAVNSGAEYSNILTFILMTRNGAPSMSLPSFARVLRQHFGSPMHAGTEPPELAAAA